MSSPQEDGAPKFRIADIARKAVYSDLKENFPHHTIEMSDVSIRVYKNKTKDLVLRIWINKRTDYVDILQVSYGNKDPQKWRILLADPNMFHKIINIVGDILAV
jgi:hypothetical protein